MHAQMRMRKSFSERSPLILGGVGVAVVVAIAAAALGNQYLPFVNHNKSYGAYFADAGGLYDGAIVQVSGLPVGKVSNIKLDGPGVLVSFTLDEAIHLGDRTEAAITTKGLLGTKELDVVPRGDNQLEVPIPLDRTTSPYQLPDALGDLATTIGGVNTTQLSDTLATVAQTFSNTAPDVKNAVQGIARFAQTLDNRDAQLRSLLDNAAKATGVLSKRTSQVVSLVRDTNALLTQLRMQSAALDQITTNISAVSNQLKGFIAENRQQLKPALDKLNGVLTIVDNRKARIQKSIKGLNTYAISMHETIGSAPFFKAYIANLLPGQFLQPFIDAAFSDLGLDPSTLPPSQLPDPQTGQSATPPLPMPYPRTGQGGPPRINLPDAITGNQDPNLPAQFPGRYPYRPEPPAPGPGGPPPGPPLPSSGQQSQPVPTSSPVYTDDPIQAPPAGGRP